MNIGQKVKTLHNIMHKSFVIKKPMENKYNSKKENIVYTGLWAAIFLSPIVTVYLKTMYDANAFFDWQAIFNVQKMFFFYFGAFLIHNYLLAPLVIYKHNFRAYIPLALLLMVTFFVLLLVTRPKMLKDVHGPFPQEVAMNDKAAKSEWKKDHKGPKDHKGHKGHKGKGKPGGFGLLEITNTMTLLFLFGMNLGAKVYFKSADDREKLEQLEKQNLQQRLDYLKVQINPHFFMNTLNNIHALVDIDPEKAKTSIVELSKLMRIILYDGDKQMMSLPKEIEFIKNYIRLMSLRFTDNVTINTEFPDNPPHKEIAPLVFVTFIENAFKHGISYMQPTKIDISIRLHGNKLLFTCANTIRQAEKSNSEEKKGGLGLANVKKRLDLIYGNAYKLDIRELSTQYKVRLLLILN